RRRKQPNLINFPSSERFAHMKQESKIASRCRDKSDYSDKLLDAGDIPAALTDDEIKARLADLDHMAATRLRVTAQYFCQCGPPLLEMPADVAAQHYRAMLNALAARLPDQAAALPPNYPEPYFLHLLDTSARIADHLRSDVVSMRVH